MKPQVSVIIPTYNAERYIKAALDSILQEKSIPLEVIVIDDGCTDNSIAIVTAIQDPRIRILSGQKRGIIGSAHAGIDAALGRVIMRCDADDQFPADRIARQMQWLDQHPEFGAVCGNYATIDTKGHLIAQLACGDQAEEITAELRGGRLRNHFCTFAIRAEILQTVRGRSALHTGADLDWQLRIGEACRVWYLPTSEYYYRLHGDSQTHQSKKQSLQFYDQLVLTLQQQRLAQGQDDLDLGRPLPSPPLNNTDSASINTATTHIQGQLLGYAWRQHRDGQKLAALQTGLRGLRLNPFNGSYWRSVIALLLKPAGR